MSFRYISSVIEKNVEIGDNTNIWYFSHLCDGVRVGNDCSIGQGVYLGPGVILGDNVRISNGVNIYPGTIIKNDVWIGNNTSFTNVRTQSVVKRPTSGKKGKISYTIIENGASIGANVTVVAGVRVGVSAVIADGSVVVDNIPDGSWANGNPAHVKSAYQSINKIYKNQK